MNNKQRKLLIQSLEVESNRLTSEITNYEVGSYEYNIMWKKILEIEKLLNEIRKPKRNFKLDKEWIPVIGSLMSILLIMNHEKLDVITTKALGFVKKA